MARLTMEKTVRKFLPNDPDQAYVDIKLLDRDEIAKIEQKATTMVFGEAGNNITLDPVKREDGIAMACLTGWGGWYGPTGKEIKFEKRNIADLRRFTVCAESGEKMRFLKWVDQLHTEFKEECEARQEDAEKN